MQCRGDEQLQALLAAMQAPQASHSTHGSHDELEGKEPEGDGGKEEEQEEEEEEDEEEQEEELLHVAGADANAVWNPAVRRAPSQDVVQAGRAALQTWGNVASGGSSCEVELQRFLALGRIKATYTRLLLGMGVRKADPAVLEKWIFTCKSHEQAQVGLTRCDPLLPGMPYSREANFMADLEQAGVPRAKCTWLGSALSSYVKKQHKAALASMQNADQRSSSKMASIERGDGDYVVRYGNKSQLRISEAHLEKLYTVFHRHCFPAPRGGTRASAPQCPWTTDPSVSLPQNQVGGQEQEQGQETAEAAFQTRAERRRARRIKQLGRQRLQSRGREQRERDNMFVTCLYRALLRYEGLQGGGFQAALPGPVFDILLRTLDARMELFASPFNARYARFCSAFPDTDAVFGSVGSFFDFEPSSGSYQANPPFVAPLILRMAQHMDGLLLAAEGSDKQANAEEQEGGIYTSVSSSSSSSASATTSANPLSFTVFVPQWESKTSYPGYRHLASSRFLRAHFDIAQPDHYYTEGKQQLRRARYRVASFTTSVFVLQTSAGAARWPVTSEVEAAIRQAFGLQHNTSPLHAATSSSEPVPAPTPALNQSAAPSRTEPSMTMPPTSQVKREQKQKKRKSKSRSNNRSDNERKKQKSSIA